ncbi:MULTISPECIES: hypothetical protein [unclassified Mannheimia]|uniref:hypothetical protein n=1 Tax=unclassified Mannheimia TaxID=2645054 RepID=UPI00359D6314
MSNTKNSFDNITADDLARYFKAKNIYKGQEFLSCHLCQHNKFSFIDSSPFFPQAMGGDEIKYRLALQPKLIKPLPVYLAEQEEIHKDKENNTGFPVSMMLKTPEIFDTFKQIHSREYLVLTCDNCGNTLLIDRDKIVEFLKQESEEQDAK